MMPSITFCKVLALCVATPIAAVAGLTSKSGESANDAVNFPEAYTVPEFAGALEPVIYKEMNGPKWTLGLEGVSEKPGVVPLSKYGALNYQHFVPNTLWEVRSNSSPGQGAILVREYDIDAKKNVDYYIGNSAGQFETRMNIPEGGLRVEFWRWHAKSGPALLRSNTIFKDGNSVSVDVMPEVGKLLNSAVPSILVAKTESTGAEYLLEVWDDSGEISLCSVQSERMLMPLDLSNSYGYIHCKLSLLSDGQPILLSYQSRHIVRPKIQSSWSNGTEVSEFGQSQLLCQNLPNVGNLKCLLESEEGETIEVYSSPSSGEASIWLKWPKWNEAIEDGATYQLSLLWVRNPNEPTSVVYSEEISFK